MTNFFLCRVLLSAFTLLFIGGSAIAQEGRAKYVFFFIGDGMGVNQVTATQMYLAAKRGAIAADSLSFTNFPVRSFITTFSASHPVTCSAAAGTALACGVKTHNGALGVDANDQPVLSIAHLAKLAGNKVGIATTVPINHATPAAFYAHQSSRKRDYEIGLDAIKANFDIYAGSMLRIRKSNQASEARNILDIMVDSSYVVAYGKGEFDTKNAGAKKMVFLGEQTSSNESSLVPVIDRRGDELSLCDITRRSIDFLMKDNDKGFFLMTEGGTIDWVLHSNDAASTFAEVLEFSDAVAIAYDFYLKHRDNTLIIVTADHETGGITLGGANSQFNPEVFAHQKSSQMGITDALTKLRRENRQVTWQSVRAVLERECGFWGKVEIDAKEEKRLMNCYSESFDKKDVEMDESLYIAVEPMATCAIDILTHKAKLGWSTGGHTVGVVPVYAIGVGAERFMGVRDNTDLTKIISEIAGY